MSKLVTKKHSYVDIVKGSMAQTQNKNQKNPTHEKPVPATVPPNNLDTETKTSDCTPKEIYVEIIKMSSPSQNITPSWPIKFSMYTCHAYAYGLWTISTTIK